MKKWLRFLRTAAAVSALILFCLPSAGEGSGTGAGEPAVFIPERIAGLGLPEMPEYCSLRTKTESVAAYGDPMDPANPCPILAEDGGKILLTFSRRPDWAGVIWSDGWENLDVDEEGNAETTADGHPAQPGIRALSGPEDPATGKPEWRWNDGGDYAFLAGFGPVTCQYGRGGHVNYVEYTEEKDYFRTGAKGAVTVIRWEPAQIKNYSERDDIHYETTTAVWYVSSVTAVYPAGNYITGVKAEFRNDRKNTLSGYTVTYTVQEKETYAITYMPDTATILEEHHYGLFYPLDPHLPSRIDYTNDPNTWEEVPSGWYLHHYTADEPIYGEYTSGDITYVSGSGDHLDRWYAPGHGRPLNRPGLRGVTSFPSPRVR